MLLYYGDFNFNIASVWLDKHIASINTEVHSVCVCVCVCVFVCVCIYIPMAFCVKNQNIFYTHQFFLFVSGGREVSQSLATCKMYNNFVKLTHFIATI